MFLLLAGLAAAPANAASPLRPVTAEQFLADCKRDVTFCRVEIAAVLLQNNHRTCLPAGVSRDAMTAKVRDVLEDVVEEDRMIFETDLIAPLSNR